MALSEQDALELIAMHLVAASGGTLRSDELRENTPIASASTFHMAKQVADARGWSLKKGAANICEPGLTLGQFVQRYRRA